jgi:putative hemolysin
MGTATMAALPSLPCALRLEHFATFGLLVVCMFSSFSVALNVAYLTVAVNQRCWKRDTGTLTRDTLLYLYQPTAATSAYARSFCENNGGARADLADPSFGSSAIWSGLQSNDTGTLFFESGTPLLPTTVIANTTFDPSRLCYDSAGEPIECEGSTKNILCQRPLMPAVYEWVNWPPSNPVMAATLMPAVSTRAVASLNCGAIGAELGYVPELQMVLDVLDKHESGGRRFIQLAKGPDLGCTPTASDKRGIWTSYNGGNYSSNEAATLRWVLHRATSDTVCLRVSRYLS